MSAQLTSVPPTRRQGVTFDDFVRARLPGLLRYLADQTEAQTAHLMGCSVGTDEPGQRRHAQAPPDARQHRGGIMNDLETRMRQAFHDDHGWQSADVLLDGVRRGVGQRRRRRALAAGTVAATGTAYKVTGNQGCQSPCSTIFRHDDSGGWETLATIHGSADSRAYGPVLQLEMAPGGQDGWAWGSGRWSTHDGGKTWTEDTSLSLPSTSDLRGIVDVYPGRSVTWTTVSPTVSSAAAHSCGAPRRVGTRGRG